MKKNTYINVILLMITFGCMGTLHAQEEIEQLFRNALYQEEVQGKAEDALSAYREVSKRLEHQRELAATALFRQAECLRKLERLDEAAATYDLVLKHYSDLERITRLSQENLLVMGQGNVQAIDPALEDLDEDEAKEVMRLQRMISESPDLLNTPSGEDAPPLITAVENGHMGVVEFLLTKEADPNVTWNDQTPLLIAARAGNMAMCEALLEHGADVNAITQQTTALLEALKAKHQTVARMLLRAGADPKLGAIREWTWRNREFKKGNIGPLHLAIGGGLNPDLVKELLDAGADPNRLTVLPPEEYQRESVLSMAIAELNVEYVRLLAPEVDIAAWEGITDKPLLIQTFELNQSRTANNKADEIANILIDAGADMSAKSSSGQTLLHYASRRDHLKEWLDRIIAAGVDVNAIDQFGRTALFDAIRYPDNFRILIDTGANVNVQDQTGQTVLHHAARSGNLEVLQLLIEAGADPEIKDPDGRTALLVATGRTVNVEDSDRLKAVELLLDVSGESETDRSGRSVYSYAMHQLTASRGGGTTPDLEQEWSIWVEAVRLFMEREIKPNENDLLPLTSDRQVSVPLPDEPEARELLHELWRMVYVENNPRLSNAVWISRSRSAIEQDARAFFDAVICDEAMEQPGDLKTILRLADESETPSSTFLDALDYTDVTIQRGDELIPVDLLTAFQSAHKVMLKWGDIVELPITSQPDHQYINHIRESLADPGPIHLRVSVGDQLIVNDPSNLSNSVFAIADRRSLDFEEFTRIAGISRPFVKWGRVARTNSKGELQEVARRTVGELSQSGSRFPLRHGDVVEFETVDEEPGPSENVLRGGVHVCATLEGPFWPVNLEGYLPPHVEVKRPILELGLLSPNGLPLLPVKWDEVIVRQWTGDEWKEGLLKDRESLVESRPGTVLILPETSDGDLSPPEWLRERVVRELSFSWKLAYEDQPFVDAEYRPSFFQMERYEENWFWHDLQTDPPRPVIPYSEDLVISQPTVGKIVPEIQGYERKEQLEGELPLYVVRVKEKQLNSDNRRGSSGNRRVILPPNLQN